MEEGCLSTKSTCARAMFDAALADSIDEAFGQILGLQAKAVLYEGFRRRHNLGREDFPNRLEEFDRALAQTFGSTSAAVLGKAIAKRFYAKLHVPFIEERGYSLQDYVVHAWIVEDRT